MLMVLLVSGLESEEEMMTQHCVVVGQQIKDPGGRLMHLIPGMFHSLGFHNGVLEAALSTASSPCQLNLIDLASHNS